jgi:crotonobetainyl-CoA:carnitine CoA-transferase CaiB-like acyl-CoA transferase
MGRADLAADCRYATTKDRLLHRSELTGPIGRWTRDHDKTDLAARLQEAGVPAAPVLGGAEIAASDAMRAAGMIAELDHPRVGRRSYSVAGFRLDRTPGGTRRAAPLFGEHNDMVLRDLLGYDDTRIAALRSSGAITDAPTADTDTPRPVPTT